MKKNADILRREALSWLRSHQDYQLLRETPLKSFVPNIDWGDYCSNLEKEDSCGDLLVLIALLELHHVRAVVISTADSQQFITSIHPNGISGSNSNLPQVFLGLCNSTFFLALEFSKMWQSSSSPMTHINNYDEEEPEDELEDRGAYKEDRGAYKEDRGSYKEDHGAYKEDFLKLPLPIVSHEFSEENLGKVEEEQSDRTVKPASIRPKKKGGGLRVSKFHEGRLSDLSSSTTPDDRLKTT